MQLAVLARVFYVLAKMEKDDVYVNHCTSLKVKRHRIRNRVPFDWCNCSKIESSFSQLPIQDSMMVL